MLCWIKCDKNSETKGRNKKDTLYYKIHIVISRRETKNRLSCIYDIYFYIRCTNRCEPQNNWLKQKLLNVFYLLFFVALVLYCISFIACNNWVGPWTVNITCVCVCDLDRKQSADDVVVILINCQWLKMIYQIRIPYSKGIKWEINNGIDIVYIDNVVMEKHQS